LLLVSPDFLASDYCYEKELSRAMQRHEAKDAKVLPVILRPCEWTVAPFGKLLSAPKDGKPVVMWPNVDEAFLDITRAIRSALETINDDVTEAKPANIPLNSIDVSPSLGPRSSNLRVRKAFTEADKDQFIDKAFEYIAHYFENSLDELEKRNSHIKTAFKRIDAHKFSSVIYLDGSTVSKCSIWLGGFGEKANEIRYSMSENPYNSFNESLAVEEGEQMLGLRPHAKLFGYGEDKQNLTFEGAAECYWSILMEPLQR